MFVFGQMSDYSLLANTHVQLINQYWSFPCCVAMNGYEYLASCLCFSGLWTISMTIHLTGPCWNRKQPNKGPPPGARASRHKPPQASKLTNPSLTWKVSSKQPSDVFSQTPIAHLFIQYLSFVLCPNLHPVPLLQSSKPLDWKCEGNKTKASLSPI